GPNTLNTTDTHLDDAPFQPSDTLELRVDDQAIIGTVVAAPVLVDCPNLEPKDEYKDEAHHEDAHRACNETAVDPRGTLTRHAPTGPQGSFTVIDRSRVGAVHARNPRV